ncbi:MAG: heat-inducible transcriptional repressor HrcA, partial [Gammaproteobacteria bacterium]|nr:heat-inducible transcriptional repressor HrcA [Gammaproteobacteria bacterium]
RIQNFEIELDEQKDTQSLIAGVSEYLSGITSLAGIVTLPRMKHMELRQVEFLPLDDNRILAILVTNQQEVQNRVLQLHRSYSPVELNQIAEFLNTRFSGKDLRQIRKELLQELKADQQSMNKTMKAAINMAEELFVEDESEGYVMAGELKLMEFEELSNINSLRDIFEAFTRKREMIHLLDKCVDAQGVKIFIGEESGYKVLGECSVVTSSYSAEGKPLGVLGVIGPTRIPYKKVIPIVDVTAKLLSAALKSRS